MKRSLLVGSFLLTISLPAEQFFGPTTQSNRFVLGSNQVAIISAIDFQRTFDGNNSETGVVTPDARLVSAQETNRVVLGEFPFHGFDGFPGPTATAIAGPVELLVNNAVLISYKVFTNSLVSSLVIKPGVTNTINVPAGKTLKFFALSLDGYAALIANATLIKPSSTIAGFYINGNEEFDGPLSIGFTFIGAGAPPYVISYYLTDQAVILPAQGAVQAPTGDFELQIQKSTDLAHWFPSVVVFPKPNLERGFYRLRFAE